MKLSFVAVVVVLFAGTASTSFAGTMSLEKATSICQEVVDLENSGELEKRLIKFRKNIPEELQSAWDKSESASFMFLDGMTDIDYDHDGKANHLAEAVGRGHSCGSTTIIDIEEALHPREQDGSFQDQEVEEIWGWATGLVVIQGEAIVLDGLFAPGARGLRRISWFDEGRSRPICEVEDTNEVKRPVAEANDEKLCYAAYHSPSSVIPWKPETRLTEAAARAAGVTFSSAQSLQADIDGDGKAEQLALMTYNSGAGCGGLRKWFVALSEDGKSIPKTLLNSVLLSDGPWLNDSPRDIDERVFTYGGKTYFVGPGETQAEVFSFQNGKRESQCKFDIRPQFQLGEVHGY